MTFWNKKHDPESDMVKDYCAEYGLDLVKVQAAIAQFWLKNTSECLITTDDWSREDQDFMAAIGFYPFKVGSYEDPMHVLSGSDTVSGERPCDLRRLPHGK